MIKAMPPVRVYLSLTLPSGIEGSSGPAFSGSSLSSTNGTRYFSDAHAPRSTILQRSEQNGRHGLWGPHSTRLAQVGQATVRTSATEPRERFHADKIKINIQPRKHTEGHGNLESKPIK